MTFAANWWERDKFSADILASRFAGEYLINVR